MRDLTAPFPWFGGKRRVAPFVWDRFGPAVGNYVEPFFGSGAVLLNRPAGAGPIETVNDADGLLCNAWRGIQQAPAVMAEHAASLAHECDLHARHAYLVGERERLTRRLEGDPEYCDLKLAGWWLWGIALWIGGGWCSGNGPWTPCDTEDGRQLLHVGNAGQGVHRKRLHLGDAGQGVHRQLLHLGDAGQGVHRQRLHLADAGAGVRRKLLHRGDAGQGGLLAYMEALSGRLQRVRVCCGDWQRICGPTPTTMQGVTAVFLDPPYSTEADRREDCYAVDNGDVAHEVREWCRARGSDPLLRIALCGYAGEGHEALEQEGWDCLAWQAHGGYGAGRGGSGEANRLRERIWFSPHCLAPLQDCLFESAAGGEERVD